MSVLKFNFIINYPDSAVAEYLKTNIEGPTGIVAETDLGWCLQTYLILAKRGNLEVYCSNKLRSDAINIIHSAQLLPLKATPADFVVCTRADFPLRRWAHYQIVQNKNQLGHDTSYVPFWNQPGLIKRNPERTGVKRVAYSGQTFNGNFAGSSDSWQSLLEPHGLEFVIIPREKWHDLSDIDLLVGIRSFDKKPHNSKPPSKLINAWHAQIPFIGGYDSAFTQIGEPDTDFLLAETPYEAVNKIVALKENPSLYQKLVANGLKKAPLYTNQAIAEEWESILTGPVKQRYERWKSRPAYEKARFSALLQAGLMEHQTKQLIKKMIR